MSLTQQEFHDLPQRPVIGTAKDSRVATPWYNIGLGIWELLLNGNVDSDERTVLQWYEPNAVSSTDQIITHTYIEEVILMEGGLEDLTLSQSWKTGAYAYRHPGMKHGPYRASESGCLLFVKTLPTSQTFT